MQDYPNYEIVVLNDSSEDGTTTVLKTINSEKLKVIESKMFSQRVGLERIGLVTGCF